MLKKLINIGITDQMDSFDKRGIRLTNAIVFSIIIFAILVEIYTLIVIGIIPAGIIQLFFSVALLSLILLLNYFHKYKLARTTLLIQSNLSLIAAILLVDNKIGASEFHYLNFILYVIILREYWKIYFWSALTITIYVFGIILEYHNYIHPKIVFPGHQYLLFRPILFIIATISIILVLIFFRKENENKENQLSRKIKYNETLLKEVHHRVKNNLQLILSLLELQMDKDIDDNSKEVLLECQNRVYAMFLVHNRLISGEERISLSDYITDLCHNINKSFPQQNIDYLLNLEEDLYCDLNKTLLLGIIINEVITNSYKHAFEQQQTNKVIEITLAKEQHKIKLVIKDNGKGNYNAPTQDDHNTLGLKLVYMIAKQLKAKIETENNKGFKVVVIF